MPFQSVRRGVAYTDHFFGTVAGDDPFMDVWVGRFSVNNTLEANSVVQKVIGYDQALQAPWRGKTLYMANWDRAEGVSLFIADSDNLIDFAYCPTIGTPPGECYISGTDVERFGYYANIDESRARGVELAGSAQFGGWFARGNFSWIDAEDLVGDLSHGGFHALSVAMDANAEFEPAVGC